MGRSDGTDSSDTPTVLYLDPDETWRRRVVSTLVSVTECAVRSVGTVTELRSTLSSAAIDCVVCEDDLGLEDQDGVTLGSQLKTNHPTTPVVIYTDGDERRASETLAAGLSGYVPKGIEDSPIFLAERITGILSADQTPVQRTHWNRIEALYDVALEFESCSTTEEAAQLAVDAVDTLLAGEGTVLFVERESPAMTRVTAGFVSLATVGTAEANQFFEQSASQSMAEQALRSGDAYSLDPHAFNTDVPMRSVACIPVSDVGVIQTASTQLEAFDQYDCTLIELLGTHLSATVTRIRSERALRSERDRFVALFENVPDPIAFTDPTSMSSIIDVNPAFEEVFGYERSELVGKSLSNLIAPDDSDRIDVYEEVGTDTVVTREVTRLTADGPREFLFRGFAIKTDTDVHQYIFYTDITDRKRRERRIRTLHDGSRKLMAAETIPDVAETAVEIAVDAFGLPLVGIHQYDAESDGLRPIAASPALRALTGEPPVIGPDGGLAWNAFEQNEPMLYDDVTTTTAVKNPDTEIGSEAYLPIGTHGILIFGSTEPAAISEEALTLGKLLAANIQTAFDRAERESELERQNHRLESFAGTVSHDLRNPLSLANGHVDLLRSCDPADQEAHLEEIEWALSRMEELIEDVLLLARSGQKVTNREPVELPTIIRQASRSIGPELEVDIADTLPVIYGDASRILVLFENLFRNSVEHGSAGPESVAYKETSSEADGETAGAPSTETAESGWETGLEETDSHAAHEVTVTVETIPGGISVADDGPGIPAGERESIFESGYTTDPDGTGFGLSIVSEVVEAHGWEIAAVENDGGARFEIRFD